MKLKDNEPELTYGEVIEARRRLVVNECLYCINMELMKLSFPLIHDKFTTKDELIEAVAKYSNSEILGSMVNACIEKMKNEYNKIDK